MGARLRLNVFLAVDPSDDSVPLAGKSRPRPQDKGLPETAAGRFGARRRPQSYLMRQTLG